MKHVAVIAILVALAALVLDTRAQSSSETLRFETQCLDLDDGLVIERCTGVLRLQSGWDIAIAFHSERTYHAVVIGNEATRTEIARLEGRSFEQVSHLDAADAWFLLEAPRRPATSDSVYLIKTDRGAMFKLGRITEDGRTVTLDYEQLLPVGSVN